MSGIKGGRSHCHQKTYCPDPCHPHVVCKDPCHPQVVCKDPCQSTICCDPCQPAHHLHCQTVHCTQKVYCDPCNPCQPCQFYGKR
ncbi:small proline-rich protein 2B-like [Xenopus tropicalis]|uniref:Small proline-rich protein 2B-like n=1 Tax=Xenopus tropicalis TaxID=8364 RepID=A0A8J1JW16_XENTR|nr:small proline-rich protein 2B-like [Xenopus tropicalis]